MSGGEFLPGITETRGTEGSLTYANYQRIIGGKVPSALEKAFGGPATAGASRRVEEKSLKKGSEREEGGRRERRRSPA